MKSAYHQASQNHICSFPKFHWSFVIHLFGVELMSMHYLNIMNRLFIFSRLMLIVLTKCGFLFDFNWWLYKVVINVVMVITFYYLLWAQEVKWRATNEFVLINLLTKVILDYFIEKDGEYWVNAWVNT